MSYKTEHKPKEFLEHFSKHNSQDISIIDVAYGCWCEMKKLYEMSIKGRKDFRNAFRDCRAENKALKEKLNRWEKKLRDSGLIREKESK